MAALIWLIPIVWSYKTFKIALSWEVLVILTTLTWLIPSVCSGMSQNISLWVKSLAHWPYWNGLSPVCSGMTFKIALLWEGLVTLTTLKWFILSVCSGMLQKISLLFESFITLTTLIWFIPSVCSVMSQKISIKCEMYMWSHTGERTYPCNQCDKVFLQYSTYSILEHTLGRKNINAANVHISLAVSVD